MFPKGNHILIASHHMPYSPYLEDAESNEKNRKKKEKDEGKQPLQTKETTSLLLKFEFEDHSQLPDTDSSPDILASHDPPENAQRIHQKRVESYYGAQTLEPGGSVSLCMNAIDRARRQCRTHIYSPTVEYTVGPAISPEDCAMFVDISQELDSTTPRASTTRRLRVRKHDAVDEGVYWTTHEVLDDDEGVDDEDIQDMILSDDEVEIGKDFELIKVELRSEYNGIAPGRQKRYWGLKKLFAP